MLDLNNILYVVAVIFIIWALLDLWKSGKDMTKKLIWTLIIIIIPLVGSIIYYFIGRK